MSKDTKTEPLEVNCFHCQGSIIIKYVRASHNYSQKNNWGYWTESKENESKQVCGDCLVRLYKNHKWEFRQLIPKKEKQTLLRQYILSGTIKGQAEAIFITNKKNKVCWLGENCPNLKIKTSWPTNLPLNWKSELAKIPQLEKEIKKLNNALAEKDKLIKKLKGNKRSLGLLHNWEINLKSVQENLSQIITNMTNYEKDNNH